MSPHPDAETLEQRIVETTHEPLLLLDEEFRVQRANPAFYRTFQTDPEETLQRPLQQLGGGQWDDPELIGRLRGVLREDAALEGLEVDRTFPLIGRRVMRLNGRRLRREGGESHHLLLAIQDVTEEEELKEKLRRYARELKRSNAELEQFAYTASHDLQEPLRMVSSYLELLERRYGEELGEEAREFMDYAVDGAQRMKSLIDGLLQYSRVGRKEGEFGPVDLDEVLDGVLEDLSPRIEELGGKVSREPLPTVHGNADQLGRVFQNLIENALTYRGDAPPRVHVSGAVERGSARVAVRDRGPGVPPEARERIFQIFHQLDPHGEGRAGSGMGLALCRKIVDRHGGEIRVESEPGSGSTFHFTLGLEPEETR